MLQAIRVENLGKRYRLSHEARRAGYRTLRESLAELVAAPLRRWRDGHRRGRPEDFWALKDVSFEIQPGDVVGIIGRNGAGKSTLLKIVSRITKPTTGCVELRGRVGSLLEVGTGFHPELTGRENIYLNGAILGMTRREIRRKFDAIVGFAEISRFLDSPVKRYSSGMYVRLAFAVAAHMDPEILVVDEVLAVGDVQFQKKCLGKMHEVSGEGRTVLLVSHNLPVLRRMCNRGILLEHGQLKSAGRIGEVVTDYLAQHTLPAGSEISLAERAHRTGTGDVLIRCIRFLCGEALPCSAVPLGKSLTVELDLLAHEATHALIAGVHFIRFDGVPVLDLRSDRQHHLFQVLPGASTVRCTIPTVPLYPGRYWIEPWVGRPGQEPFDHVRETVSFEVLPPETDPLGRFDPNFGVVVCPAAWAHHCP